MIRHTMRLKGKTLASRRFCCPPSSDVDESLFEMCKCRNAASLTLTFILCLTSRGNNHPATGTAKSPISSMQMVTAVWRAAPASPGCRWLPHVCLITGVITQPNICLSHSPAARPYIYKRRPSHLSPPSPPTAPPLQPTRFKSLQILKVFAPHHLFLSLF